MANFYLEQTTYDDLKRLIRKEIEGFGDGNVRGGGSKLISYIIVTGAEDDGWYPCTARTWNTDNESWTTYATAWASDANDKPLAEGITYLGVRAGGRTPLSSGLAGVSEFVVVGSLPVGCGFKWGTTGANKGKLLWVPSELFGCGFDIPEEDCELVTFKASDAAGDYLTPDGCLLHVNLPDIVIDLPLVEGVTSKWVLTGQQDYTCQKLEVVTGATLIDDVLTLTKKWIQFTGKVTDTEPEECCGEAVCAAIIPGFECPECEPDPPEPCECIGETVIACTVTVLTSDCNEEEDPGTDTEDMTFSALTNHTWNSSHNIGPRSYGVEIQCDTEDGTMTWSISDECGSDGGSFEFESCDPLAVVIPWEINCEIYGPCILTGTITLAPSAGP